MPDGPITYSNSLASRATAFALLGLVEGPFALSSLFLSLLLPFRNKPPPTHCSSKTAYFVFDKPNSPRFVQSLAKVFETLYIRWNHHTTVVLDNQYNPVIIDLTVKKTFHTLKMKFFYPLALALAAVVAAADDDCDAAPIVEACLTSENAKVKDCNATDYDCLCAAYQAVATCYNNCPKDSRAAPAQGQVTIYCQQASLYGSAAMRKTQSVVSATGSASAAVASNSASATAAATGTSASGSSASATASASSSSSSANIGVGQLARNTGGVLLAVAGVVAAVL
ncbi:hypothetical protein CPAR01_03974 [Colletotrichum paranaense]|uniref:Gpi anchored serine-threonine rich protein n=1 Tax=Colletotrichum paranaense TaxID=1914294 RepID=A0ABQ9SUZ0_9PEZI|nr:uncharacterized protein CPAR01_03974 [Colletotrichum paranaense]KAK1543341.1 hypothetical protein CPAR01_03974 [Colletotrichum paranaense]